MRPASTRLTKHYSIETFGVSVFKTRGPHAASAILQGPRSPRPDFGGAHRRTSRGARGQAHAQEGPSARTLRQPAPPCVELRTGDIESLKATLSAFEQARLWLPPQGGHRLLRRGKPSQDRAWFDRLPAKEAVQAIGATSAGLGGSLALVYDVGRVEGRSWVCAWLLSANGLEAAAMVPLPADTAPQVIQAGLRVRDTEGRPRTGPAPVASRQGPRGMSAGRGCIGPRRSSKSDRGADRRRT